MRVERTDGVEAGVLGRAPLPCAAGQDQGQHGKKRRQRAPSEQHRPATGFTVRLGALGARSGRHLTGRGRFGLVAVAVCGGRKVGKLRDDLE